MPDLTAIAPFITNIVQQAALASAAWLGKGDETAADAAAVSSMRQGFSNADFSAQIVIGEGERDQAPMLYIGEKLGQVKAKIDYDIAVDPLEGTTICAQAQRGAMSVLAIAQHGHIFQAPDLYMQKFVTSSQVAAVDISLDLPLKANLAKIASAKNLPLEQLTVAVLNRKRHQQLIEDLRIIGVKVHLFSDGDVAMALRAAQIGSGIDVYLGTGGAPEGVLAAAALASFSGNILTRFIENPERKILDLDYQAEYRLTDLISGPCLFVATGVSDGDLLPGIKINSKSTISHSLITNSATGIIQRIQQELPS